MGDVVTSIFGGGAREGSGGPSPEDLALFPLNDIGNAMRLILLAGGYVHRDGRVDATRSTLLFQHGGGWVGFNGVHWDKEMGEELARKLAHQVAHKMPSLWEIYKANGFNAKDFFKFANDSGSAGKTSAMLRQAQSYLTVKIDVFDPDPFALNCLNGTVKMGRAGGRFVVQLAPHDPADRITRVTSVDYDPDAKAPLFEKVVAEALPNPEERSYTHQCLGYGSTGCTHEQAFFFFQGKGRDGKSTILDACRETLGGYGLAASPDTFLEGGMRSGGDAAPDLIALSGDMRLAILSEPKRGSKMNEGLLKAWTSGSPVSARDLHSKPINFRPKAKLFWEMNSFVVARGDDDGIWRRLRAVLFRKQVPEDQVDRLLPEKLAPERPGILNWLIAGVGDWLEAGKLEPPESLKKVVDEYRRSSSPFGDWLNDHCVFGDAAVGERTLASDLYASFKEWSEEGGNDRVMSVTAFGNALRDRQIMFAGKNAQGKKYRGPIRLKTAAERLQGTDEAAAFVAPAGVGGVDDNPFDAPDDWGGR